MKMGITRTASTTFGVDGRITRQGKKRNQVTQTPARLIRPSLLYGVWGLG